MSPPKEKREPIASVDATSTMGWKDSCACDSASLGAFRGTPPETFHRTVVTHGSLSPSLPIIQGDRVPHEARAVAPIVDHAFPQVSFLGTFLALALPGMAGTGRWTLALRPRQGLPTHDAVRVACLPVSS